MLKIIFNISHIKTKECRETMKYIYLLVATFSLFNIVSSQDGNTPTDLRVDVASVGGVMLSWEAPANFAVEWITHSNQTFQWGIGANGAEQFDCHKFPDSMLTDYHGMLVKDIAFVPTDTASFQLFVFETDPDDSTDIPDLIDYTNLVLSAPALTYENEFFVWKTIGLNNHVPGSSLENDIQPSSYHIDSTKTIWFGYWLYNYTGFPAGADVGPAHEGLGNVLIWCPTSGCFESTLNEAAQEGWTLDNDWMLALSLVAGDTTQRNANSALLSSPREYNPGQSKEIFFSSNAGNQFTMHSGPISHIAIEPLNEISREVVNYFLYENGNVVDVSQPTYMDIDHDREHTILGPRDPGIYEYFVRAQTGEGISEPSNIVTTEISNNVPTTFNLIAPEDGTVISVNQATISNTINFIWTNSIDSDGQDLNFTFNICSSTEGESICYDTTMTDRLFQVSAQELVDSLSLQSGNNPLIWSVFVSDGIDSVFANDSMRVVTLSLDLLSTVSVSTIPSSFNLHQNYPNPFNPITSLRYDLPEDGLVNITIYDMMGRIVKTLVNSSQTAGYHSINWGATSDRNEPVSAGLYIYTIQAGEFRHYRKMVLLK